MSSGWVWGVCLLLNKPPKAQKILGENTLRSAVGEMKPANVEVSPEPMFTRMEKLGLDFNL